MQVRLVNPLTYAANGRHRSNGLIVPNRRRRKHGASPRIVVIRTRANRARRRNPLIMPSQGMFGPAALAANPLILPNRRRRRHGVRNPNLSDFLMTTGMGVLGGGGTYLVNKYGIGRVGVDASGASTQNGPWLRAAIRLGLGFATAWFAPGKFGGAVNGAMSYAMFSDIDQNVLQQPAAAPGGAAATSAYLTDASLDDVLDGL